MIPYIQPDLGEVEAQAAYDVILSGWVNEGALADQFAREFADVAGTKYAIPTTNGTSALALSLMGLGITGQEVIVPDLTMIGTAMGVVLSGNTPVVVDVRPDNGCIDPEAVRQAISKRTAAIMPVHLNGRNAVDRDLLQVADDHGLAVVEDAAPCIGSRLEGEKSAQLGTTGIAGCFSLAATKMIVAGQGGVIVTNDDDLFEKITRLKDWGRFEDKGYNHHQVGFNFKFNDIQASVALAQLRRLPDLTIRKKHIYERYSSRLGELMFSEQDDPGFCPASVDIRGQHFRQRLSEMGVQSVPIWPALHQQGALGLAEQAFKYPRASELAAEVLWLPSSTKLTDDQIDYICDVILGEIA